MQFFFCGQKKIVSEEPKISLRRLKRRLRDLSLQAAGWNEDQAPPQDAQNVDGTGPEPRALSHRKRLGLQCHLAGATPVHRIGFVCVVVAKVLTHRI